jgi:hypothetical protein
MACPYGLSNRRGRHALLQNVHSSRLGAPDGARESPGRRHRRAPEVGVSGDIQASALQTRSASPGSAPASMMPVPRRTGWCLHGLQAVGRAKARSRNAPTTKRFSFLTIRGEHLHAPACIPMVSRDPSMALLHSFVRTETPGKPMIARTPHASARTLHSTAGQRSPAATGDWSMGAGRSPRAAPLRRRRRIPPHIQMVQRAVEEAGEVVFH